MTNLGPGFSFNMLALLFLAHGMPRARDYTAKYFNLAYYNTNTGNYGLGWDDGYLILFCIVLLTGLRAATMEYILAPFAKSQGISKRKDHWQMFTHHIVTSVLIYASYRYGHTRVGNLILVLMDVSDLVLGVRVKPNTPSSGSSSSSRHVRVLI